MERDFIKKFDNLKEANLLNLKSANEKGRKTIGYYCTYAPHEIAEAAGAYSVTLCGTNAVTIPDAEKELPRNLCPLIKSSYGFAVTDKCPYFFFSDMIVGETTCDGKKKMYEMMSEFKNTHIMQMLPNQSQESIKIMKSEILKLIERVELLTENTVSEEALFEAIKLLNEERKALKDLFDINQSKPALLSGSEMLKVSWQSGFHLERRERIEMIKELVSILSENQKAGCYVDTNHTPRVLLTGVPTGMGSEKVFSIVEECGGNVVVFENCTGYKAVDLIVDETLAKVDPYQALAERYIKIPCSIMSPNRSREEKLEKLISDFKIDAVINLTWQACHTYNIEANYIEKLVRDKLNLPYLHIETDYSSSDWESLKIRVKALLEMI